MNLLIKKSLNTFGLVFLIGMNMLAVLLPLGDKTTGELSDMYPNLFVPAGFTFAIWSVIYILLIIFISYLWWGKRSEEIIDTIGSLFVINALANGLWLVFWHYEFVIVCIFVMLILLVTLILIYRKLAIGYFKKSNVPWQISVPVSVYLGWISVATIANATTVFVYTGNTELGLGADLWATIVLLIAVGIAIKMLYNHRDVFFAAVVCWASFGIYSKRVADVASNDIRIEHTAYICMFILIIGIILTLVQSFLKSRKSIL